jgi:hypothetical protein
MGNSSSTEVYFKIDRILTTDITIGLTNNGKQGLRYDNQLFYLMQFQEYQNKLIYQFRNEFIEQVFLELEKGKDNKIYYCLEIKEKKIIGQIDNIIQNYYKDIGMNNTIELDKIANFIQYS